MIGVKNGMRIRLRRLSLRTQMMTVLCVVMIPMYVLVVTSGLVSLNHAEQRLLTVYENKADMLADSLDRIEEELGTEMDLVFFHYSQELLSETEWNPMLDIRIVTELKNIWKRVDMIYGVYLKDANDGQVFISHDNSRVSFEDVEEIRQILSEEPREESAESCD